MSGNGRGVQKPSSRPPFLVIGLLVALAILGFNYWNLSMSNSNLSSTNIDLQDQLRIISSRKITEEQTRKDVERKYALLEGRIQTKDSEIKRLQEDMEVKNSEKERAENIKKECETNLQTCETNNAGIQQQLGEVNQQLDELKKKEDQKQDCDSQCKENVKRVYTDMFQKLGPSTMQQLINAGIDIGDDLKSQVLQQNQQQPQQQQQQQSQQQPQQPQQPADGQPQAVTGKESTAPKGIDNSFLNLKDRLKQTMHSLSQTGSDIVNKTQEGIKQGVESLSQKSGVHDIINTTQEAINQGIDKLSQKGPDMHAIVKQTQEGIKQGMKKSQEIAGLIYGGDKGKEHDSNQTLDVGVEKNESNKTQDVGVEKNTKNDLKHDTLVGNKDPQQPGAAETNTTNTQINDKKPDETQKTGDVKNEQVDKEAGSVDKKEDQKVNIAPQDPPKQEQNQLDNKPVDQVAKKIHDTRYDDDDNDKDVGNKVEENRPLRFRPDAPKKTDEDSIDALRRRLNN